MRNTLKDFFYYTPAERNGFIILFTLSIGFAFYPFIYSMIFPTSATNIQVRPLENAPSLETRPVKNLFPFDPNTAVETTFAQLGLTERTIQTIVNYRNKGGRFKTKSDFKKIYTLPEQQYLQLAPYIEIEQPKYTARIPKDIPRSYDHPISKPSKVFPFDPNTASVADFEKLGLTDKVIQTILKFRARGRFWKASDFDKIFGLTDADFQRLKPYIKIEKTRMEMPKKSVELTKTAASKKETVQIDINEAAIEEWQLLRGIGATYAKRIVRFREQLGGFYSIDQIKEVYNLPDSTFQTIRPQLSAAASTNLRTININTATTRELKAHPYLKPKQAQIIVNYRENHGAYKTVDDLNKIRIFDQAFVGKIKPYLRVE